MNKKAQEGFFVAIIILLFLFSIVALIFLSGMGASEGKHTGVVTAVEHNSYILFPADKVYFKSDAQSTQEDIYCVNDAQVKADLETFSKDRKRVTISYKNNFIMWKWECNGGQSIITGVEE